MTVAAASTNSQTATISTEHTLFDSSASGIYDLAVDLDNMADGDILELRVYLMVRTGGTRRELFYERFVDADGGQLQPIVLSFPVSTDLADSGAVRFTLKQTAGTGRVYPWTVRSYT